MPTSTEERKVMDADAATSPIVDAAEARLVSSGIISLTLAARRGGTEGVVTTLSRLLNGWAVLVDRYGEPIAAVGAGRIHIDDAITAATQRSRRQRNPELQTFPVGRAEDPRATLVVSARRGATSRTRDLSTQAAALLDLTYFPKRDARLEQLARQDVVEVLLNAPASLARSVASRWGLTGSELVVCIVKSRSRAVVLETKALDWLEELELPPVAGMLDGDVVVVIAPEAVPAWIERVVVAATTELVPVRCGVSAPAALGALAEARSQAVRAVGVALADDRPAVEFARMASVAELLRALPSSAVTALVEPLRPLAAEADGQLLESLRVFLAENGSWEAAATQLGVHRHTLRNRMQKIEELTGLSMTSAEDRALAWLALQARS
ncbi:MULTISPECIES: CdaR family transcriptional regulator [unclassified Leifsonia]|uniref:PucR family transcriptional regulator n=1 Tax=unclassified Leifsonia TaxID=2663824 RepID=UPI0025C4A8EE|nr:helix-turn-helix domain-containing protein [Leifsonia sp. 71-9]